jgi:small subunit ribosomal protein S16
VADQRSPRDGRFIETIGHYNPQTNPSIIRIDEDRLQHWLARGAQPSGSVKQLMKAQAKSGGPTPVDAPARTTQAPPEPEPAAAVAEAEEPAAEAPETEAAEADDETAAQAEADASGEPEAAEPDADS